MTRDIAEKCFFRYQKGEWENYSTPTLLSLVDHLPAFAKVIVKRPQRFIDFLLDVPLEVFQYYYTMSGAFFDLYDVFEDKRIEKRANAIHHEDAQLFLVRELDTLNEVASVKALGLRHLLVTFKKLHQASSLHNCDLLLTLSSDGVHTQNLSNTSHFDTRNRIYIEEGRQACVDTITAFEKRYRLHLCLL